MRDFGTRCKRNPKNVKEWELLGWNDMVVWKDFRSCLMRQLIVTIRCGKSEPTCSRFHYLVHQWLRSFHFAYEVDGMIFFITSIFYLFFFTNIFSWQHFYAASNGSWMRAKPNGAFCWNVCWFSNIFFSYVIISLNLINLFFFLFRIYITVDWRRETRMILRFILILIWICD